MRDSSASVFSTHAGDGHCPVRLIHGSPKDEGVPGATAGVGVAEGGVWQP